MLRNSIWFADSVRLPMNPAKAALADAHAIAVAHDLHAWSFRTERALRDVDAAGDGGVPEPATPRRDSPAVREVAAGLEEYAAATR